MLALRAAGFLALLAHLSLALPTGQPSLNWQMKSDAQLVSNKTQNGTIIMRPEHSSKDSELIIKEVASESGTTDSLAQDKNSTDEKKKVVTYILGQPNKGSVQSPAELLSPDRYEFYTFDDDGKIIKKLMNVEEIQKLIASSKENVSTNNQQISDYYQVLTVTPDIESVPAVKLNPNEPLFSIHDVIASVQNVLKNEIKQKMTQPPPALVLDGFQNVQLTPEGEESPISLSLNSTEIPKFEVLRVEEKETVGSEMNKTTPIITTPYYETTTETKTEKLAIVVKEEATIKATSTTPKTTAPEKTTKKPTTATQTKKPTATTKKPTETVTKQPDTPLQTTVNTTLKDNKPSGELKSAPLRGTESPVSKPTMIQVLKVTSSVSQSSNPVTQGSSVITTARPDHSEKTTPQSVGEENKSNESDGSTTDSSNTESEMGFSPIVVPAESPLSLLDAHPGFVSNETFVESSAPSESLFSIENQLFDNVNTLKNSSEFAQLNNYTAAESALSEVQIPMNQDLAESVSSVLSQIANEISLNTLSENSGTTTVPITTVSGEATEITFTTTEESATILPISWLKNSEDATLDESTTEITTTPEEEQVFTTAAPSVPFIPQNKPRPFSKPSIPETLMLTTESQENVLTTQLPTMESRTELEIATPLPESDGTTTTEPYQEEATTVNTIVDNTSNTVQSEKKNDPANPVNRLQVIENNGNSSSSIEIIQEAETGRIPRPTQRPEEITTRPGTSKITTTQASSKSTNKGNTIEELSTTNVTPATTTVHTTSTQPASTSASEYIETTSSITLDEARPDEDAENITISFLPMLIRTSSVPPEESTTEYEDKSSENLKLESSSGESIESKIIPEELVEKSAPIISSHKVEIAAITEEITAPLATSQNDPPPTEKQNFARPQSNVKPQKPVYIKPMKGKPQPLETKPNKPTRPSSSEEEQRPYETPLLSSPSALELDQAPLENLGLMATTVHLESDVRDFVDLCNELAFSLWSSITHNGLSFVRSVVVSPFAVTSLLAMVFLGARGPTSGQMNEILKLDDVVTFNPHLVFRNVTESLVIARHPGVATAAFVRELYSDRSKGKLLDFYKERAQQFYDGHVEEVNFKAIGETLRRQTNHLVKRQTWGKVKDFLQGSTLMLRAPLAAFSANIFQADCSRASTKERDGEMYFVVLPSNRLRRLVPIPAAVWRDDFLAGYEPNLDATAAAVGSVGGIVSTIFVMPGQQGLIAPGDSLARLEHHLLGSSYKRGHWERLLRSLLRRPGLELQVPRLSHKSVVNVTASLQKMGLRDLFSAEKADLTGLNGLANDLHLSDMLQVNQFSTCGDDPNSIQTHTEYYPATPLQRREKSADNVLAESIESLFAVSDFEDPSIAALPLELRPRQARVPSVRLEGRAPDPPRLRLDRPFLFFVRHNPTGMILHVGRFNPRLMH